MQQIDKELENLIDLDINQKEIELKIIKAKTNIPLTELRRELKKIEKQKESEEKTKKQKEKFNPCEIAEKIILSERIITSEEIDKIYYYNEGIYSSAEKKLLKDLQKSLKKECSEARIREIFGHIKRLTYKSEREISESNGNCICLKNGLYNLDDNTLSSFNVNKIFFNKIPVEFVEGADCPKFKKFLVRACTLNNKFDDEKFKTIQEFMGYCLEKGYKIHKILVLYGESDTSKTQFMIILQNILGKENFESIYPQQLFKDNYSIMLYKKMANLTDEIPSGAISTARIKGLSGESEQTGRELYSKPFKFVNEAKLIFAGNKLPKIKEDDVDDDAVFNRPLLVKFNNKVKDSEKIEKFGEKLFLEESSGILNFMIEGLKRLREQKKFSYSKTIEENKEIWLYESEPVYKFFSECKNIEFERGAICEKTELYNIYCEWCEENDIQWLEYNAFGRKVCSMFKNKIVSSQPLNKINGKQEHCFTGIKLKEVYN